MRPRFLVQICKTSATHAKQAHEGCSFIRYVLYTFNVWGAVTRLVDGTTEPDTRWSETDDYPFQLPRKLCDEEWQQGSRGEYVYIQGYYGADLIFRWNRQYCVSVCSVLLYGCETEFTCWCSSLGSVQLSMFRPLCLGLNRLSNLQFGNRALGTDPGNNLS